MLDNVQKIAVDSLRKQLTRALRERRVCQRMVVGLVGANLLYFSLVVLRAYL